MARNKQTSDDLLSQVAAPFKPMIWMVGVAFVGMVGLLIWLQIRDLGGSKSAFQANSAEQLAVGRDYKILEMHSGFESLKLKFDTFEPFHLVQVSTVIEERQFSHPYQIDFAFSRDQVDSFIEAGGDGDPVVPDGLFVARYEPDTGTWGSIGNVQRVNMLRGTMFRMQSKDKGTFAMGRRRWESNKTDGTGGKPKVRSLEPGGKKDTNKEDTKDEPTTYVVAPLKKYDFGEWVTLKGFLLKAYPDPIKVGEEATVSIVHEDPDNEAEAFWKTNGQTIKWLVVGPDEDEFSKDAMTEHFGMVEQSASWKLTSIPTGRPAKFKVIFQLLEADGENVVRGEIIVNVVEP